MNLAIVHNLPPGGQKRVLYEQVKRLSRRHQLDLFTLSSTDESFLSLKPFIKNHYTAYYYPFPHFPKNLFSIYFKLPKAYKKLAQMINSKNYDVAYVHPCYLTQTPYILRYLKIPSLYFCPEPKREFYEKIPHASNKFTYAITYPLRFPIKYIDRKNISFAKKIITNSKYSQIRIQQIYQKKAFVIPLGVDTNRFKPLNLKKENLILTTGEFSLHKGHDFILKAISLFPENKRPKLAIIGHGGIEKEYLRKLAKKLKVKLIILENISDEELIKWYNKARVFVYAGIKEPFGMVILEAASCGLPIVAIDEGGIKEILTKEITGKLTKRQEKDFADAISEFFSWTPKKNRIKQQRNFIRKNWNWEKSVFLLEKYFEEIIQ